MRIFFTSFDLVSQFPPTRFPHITAIRMCHLLPVHHLGMAFLAELKVKIQHGYKLGRSLEKINHLMYMDDIKLFAKNEKELKTLTLVVRIYIQDIGMEFGIENVQCL